MRCGRCGNDNSDTNRFCGMCGAPLVSASAPTSTLPRSAAATAQSPAVQSAATQTATRHQPSSNSNTSERHAASHYDASPKREPVITGPSFLGLSSPGPASDRHSAHDHLPPSSRNLDYLLDDEEDHKHGWGKFFLAMVALALALGFGYLHYKQVGFDWLNPGGKKPAAAPTQEAAPNTDSSAPATPPASAPQSGATANTAPAPASGAAAAPTDAAGANSSQNTSQAPTSPNPTGPNNAAPDTPQNTVPQSKVESKPESTSEDSPAPKDSAVPPAPADSETSAETIPAPPKARERKPAPAKPPAAKPYDPVAEAERYIYGRGARQDCDHGMRLLKTAAQQSNPKAMISMGTVYSTGTCTPRDLPTAYRWFAQALHKQPDNQALQDDLKNLWEKMTQPERQLAIKLSQ